MCELTRDFREKIDAEGDGSVAKTAADCASKNLRSFRRPGLSSVYFGNLASHRLVNRGTLHAYRANHGGQACPRDWDKAKSTNQYIHDGVPLSVAKNEGLDTFTLFSAAQERNERLVRG